MSFEKSEYMSTKYAFTDQELGHLHADLTAGRWVPPETVRRLLRAYEELRAGTRLEAAWEDGYDEGYAEGLVAETSTAETAA